MPHGVVLKDERPTSNIERPTSNEKQTSSGEHSKAICVLFCRFDAPHRYRTLSASLIPPTGGRIVEYWNVQDAVFVGHAILGFLSSLSSRSYVCFFIFSHSTFDVGRSMFDVHLFLSPCWAKTS